MVFFHGKQMPLRCHLSRENLSQGDSIGSLLTKTSDSIPRNAHQKSRAFARLIIAFVGAYATGGSVGPRNPTTPRCVFYLFLTFESTSMSCMDLGSAGGEHAQPILVGHINHPSPIQSPTNYRRAFLTFAPPCRTLNFGLLLQIT